MKALLVGGTGATGRELVGQLLTSNSWTAVISVGRRNVDLPPEYKGADRSKLKEVIVNMDHLGEAREAFQGVDVVFCTLGTTRKAAGSAEAFVKVDFEYVKAAAELAKQAGVPQFSLLTAQGAKANVWAPYASPFHGLLYMQTKGRAEEAVKAQDFKRTSIFQPGLLLRNEPKRDWKENLVSKVLSGISVRDVAKAMIIDAEKNAGQSGVRFYSMKEMLASQQL